MRQYLQVTRDTASYNDTAGDGDIVEIKLSVFEYD